MGVIFSSLVCFLAWLRSLYWWLIVRPNILDLPPEILETILLKVSNNSYTDLMRCKKVCVGMQDMLETETFFRSVDLFAVDTSWRDIRSFDRACVQYENPSALFMLGAWEFFRNDNMEEGLLSKELDVERGYDLALYTYAFLTRIMFPGLVFNGSLVNLSREFVRSEKLKVQASTNGTWINTVPALYAERVTQLQVHYEEINSCPCQVINRWGQPWDDCYKKEPCDACFWKMQTLAFDKEFPKKVTRFILSE